MVAAGQVVSHSTQLLFFWSLFASEVYHSVSWSLSLSLCLLSLHPNLVRNGLARDTIVEAVGPNCIISGQVTPVKLLGLKGQAEKRDERPECDVYSFGVVAVKS